MKYSVEIINREIQKTSIWSGGKTTELAIYPEDSEYKARNFKWRLSSASVDIEESTFTSLPGVWRHIMILEGEMELQHEGHYNVLLKPFDSDSFSGGWTTRSKGKARDFNLMLSEGCEGALEAMTLKTGMSVEASPSPTGEGFGNFAEAYYCETGEIQVSTGQAETYNLCQGDLLLLTCGDSTSCEEMKLRITGILDAAVIRAKISY